MFGKSCCDIPLHASYYNQCLFVSYIHWGNLHIKKWKSEVVNWIGAVDFQGIEVCGMRDDVIGCLADSEASSYLYVRQCFIVFWLLSMSISDAFNRLRTPEMTSPTVRLSLLDYKWEQKLTVSTFLANRVDKLCPYRISLGSKPFFGVHRVTTAQINIDVSL